MPLSKPSQPSKSPPWAMTHLRLVVIWIGLLLGLMLLFRLIPLARIAPNPEEHAGVGKPLTHLALSPLTGGAKAVAWSELLGRVTLLNFWGTWCRPCRDELPHLAELRRRYAGREAFQLLAVSCPAGGMPDDVQSLREQTAAMLKQFDLDLPTYYDPQMATRAGVEQLTGATGYPLSVLLDRRGIIRAVWVGYWPGVETEMERYVGDVLEEEKPAN